MTLTFSVVCLNNYLAAIATPDGLNRLVDDAVLNDITRVLLYSK